MTQYLFTKRCIAPHPGVHGIREDLELLGTGETPAFLGQVSEQISNGTILVLGLQRSGVEPADIEQCVEQA